MTDVYALIRTYPGDDDGEDCVGLYSSLGLARGEAFGLQAAGDEWRIYRVQLDSPAWPRSVSELVETSRDQ